MKDDWAEKLSCATHCYRCEHKLDPKDLRILSVYDHQAICMACKNDEQERPDYEEVFQTDHRAVSHQYGNAIWGPSGLLFSPLLSVQMLIFE